MSDAVLEPYLRASGDAESQSLLSTLISEHAAPVIKKVVNYKLLTQSRAGHTGERQEAFEEVHGEIVVQLLQRLRKLKADDPVRPIEDFQGYVAAVAYNACDRYVSRKYPQRRRLKNGLRYLLTHRAGLALWQDENGAWLAGLASWRTGVEANGAGASAARNEYAERLRRLHEDPYVFLQHGAGEARAESLREQRNAYELLQSIFVWTGGPVELDELVSVVAVWWNVQELEIAKAVESRFDEEPAGESADERQSDIGTNVERRAYLRRLWEEIAQLPARQRAAVLLNLRDERGRGVVDLWTLTGIVAPQDLADALSVSFADFVEMLSELPFDDARIAAHLGLTRQQVINLRKSARERLARRMKGF